jgi:hypothetical protein
MIHAVAGIEGCYLTIGAHPKCSVRSDLSNSFAVAIVTVCWRTVEGRVAGDATVL